MADNNLARNRNDLPDFFADDDPLAELARIVGYDARPAPAVAEPGGDPAINLEDELLREFERYDAPRLDPVHDMAFDEANEPVAVNGNEGNSEASASVPAVSVDNAPEQESTDAAIEGDLAAPDFDFRVEGPVSAVPPAPEDVSSAKAAAAEPVIDEFDLASELESSFAETVEPASTNLSVEEPAVEQPVAAASQSALVEPAPVEPARVESAPVPSVEPDREGRPQSRSVSGSLSPSLRMPLANFTAAKAAPQPRSESRLRSEPQFEPQFEPQAEVIPESASEPVPAVADIPVAKRPAAPAPAVPVEPTPVAKAPQLQPDVETPAAPSVAKEPPASVAAPAVEESDPFSDEEFELALDDLDLQLDLDDLVVDEPAPVSAAPAVAAAPQPVQQPSPPVKPVVSAAPQPVVAAPAPKAPEPKAPEVIDGIEPDELPFDPSQIADADEHVEAISELDVPALPAEEPVQPAIYRQDYEMDLDAELASLLVDADTGEKAPAPNVGPADAGIAAAAAVNVAAQGKPGRVEQPGFAESFSELDDFERALEEDFRKSLDEPLRPADQDELHYADADYAATVETSRRSVRGWAVPVALAVFVILGGAGVYAFIANGVSGVAGTGEPIIIAADTEPVKIAPENPGGRIVPNQDKAVYDRVAGGAAQDPKQEQLISSSELPLDVVQKTLMNDGLPLEGENDVDPADARLSSDDGAEVAAASGEQSPVTLAPRRVKTMIVRPDGRLVEQVEEPSPVPALAAPETEKLPAAGIRPAEVAAVSPESDVASVDLLTGGQNATVDGAAESTATPAPDASAETEVSGVPAVNAPVPRARPARQPVNVIASVSDQGNVSPSTQPPAASQPAATASTANPGGYLIQIASLPSEADAQKSYQNLSNKFASVIGGRGVDIKSADIPGKGTFYRVRIPAGSKSDAVELCERYRSAGGNCLVAR